MPEARSRSKHPSSGSRPSAATVSFLNGVPVGDTMEPAVDNLVVGMEVSLDPGAEKTVEAVMDEKDRRRKEEVETWP